MLVASCWLGWDLASFGHFQPKRILNERIFIQMNSKRKSGWFGNRGQGIFPHTLLQPRTSRLPSEQRCACDQALALQARENNEKLAQLAQKEGQQRSKDRCVLRPWPWPTPWWELQSSHSVQSFSCKCTPCDPTLVQHEIQPHIHTNKCRAHIHTHAHSHTRLHKCE